MNELLVQILEEQYGMKSMRTSKCPFANQNHVQETKGFGLLVGGQQNGKTCQVPLYCTF